MAGVAARQDGTSTSPKSNIDTQNDGLEKVTPASNMTIFGIHVSFSGVYPSYPKNPGV